MTPARIALVALVGVSLGGCAIVPKSWRVAFARFTTPREHVVAARVTAVGPLPTASAINVDDRLYEDAVHAIDIRDYGAALDLLQAARNQKADDVRVLNAFGVVYDKLGRFDLSTRYYAQAQAIDPASQIVRQNLAYSEVLQGKHPAKPAALALASPQLGPASGGGLVQVAPGVVRLEFGPVASLTVTRTPPGLTGHALVLVDATGGADVAQPVRQRLARLGWSLAAATPVQGRQPRTLIEYAPRAQSAAEALARTLPRTVQLAACSDGCEGVKLILGADAATWEAPRPHAARPSA